MSDRISRLFVEGHTDEGILRNAFGKKNDWSIRSQPFPHKKDGIGRITKDQKIVSKFALGMMVKLAEFNFFAEFGEDFESVSTLSGGVQGHIRWVYRVPEHQCIETK